MRPFVGETERDLASAVAEWSASVRDRMPGRDGRATTIYEGTSEIRGPVIARSLLAAA